MKSIKHLKQKGNEKMSKEIATVFMNELSFNNRKLTSVTKSIVNYANGIEANKIKMAAEINRVLSEKLFVDDFDKFETYTMKTFGLAKAMAYNYANVGAWAEKNDKGNPTGQSVLVHRDEKGKVIADYSITKLLQIIPVELDTAKKWDENGIINPSMSVKEIKAIVKAWKNCEAAEAEAVEAEAVEAVEAEAVDACEMALQNILNGIATLKGDIRFADCNEQFNLIEQQIKKIEEKF